MSTLSTCLTQQQRKLADTIILQIFRGDYADALSTLTITRNLKDVSLPPLQENILRRIIMRLQSPQDHSLGKLMPLKASHMKFKGLNAKVSVVDTQIPPKILAQIYEHAMTLSYHKFYKKLQQWQWIEHTIIEHNIYLYEQCLKMRMAQQVMNHMNLDSGLSVRLWLQYMAIIVLSYFLLVLFRME